MLSSADGDTQARDLITILLTRQGGEYLLRLGVRPPRAPLFAHEDIDNADGWAGEERTAAEIDMMIGHLSQLVDEIGGKVQSAVDDRASSLKPTFRLAS